MRHPFTASVIPVLAAWLAVALAAHQACAQARGSLGNRSGSLRQDYQSFRSGSQLPFSSQGMGSSFGQQGGFGQGAGQRGFGGRGGGTMGAAGGMQGQGALAQGPMTPGLAQTANERFQEGGFVGRDAQDVQNTFESFSGGRAPGMMDMMIENLNEMREARRRWREQNSAPPPIRVRLQAGFDMPARPATQSAAVVQTRLTKAMAAGRVQSAQVEIAGGTAVLRGVVANEHDRLLVARLASLEPGVSRVENLVTIQAPALRPPQ